MEGECRGITKRRLRERAALLEEVVVPLVTAPIDLHYCVLYYNIEYKY